MISGWKMLPLRGLLFVGLAINLVIAQDTSPETTTTAPGSVVTTESSETTVPGGAKDEGKAATPAPETTGDTASQNADYCDPSLCTNGHHHVACNASTELYYKCSLDAEVIPINDRLKTYITRRINEMRNMVAQGGYNGLGPAARMGTLTWNSELAYLAEFNVRKCFLQHDKCRNTKDFKHVGQLVGYRGLKGNIPILEDIILDIGKAWLKTSQSSSIVDVAKNKDLNELKGGPPKYNFLQIVLEDAKQLGCAIVQQVHLGWFQTFFTCNFEHAPHADAPIYEMSKEAATSCKTGAHKKYKHLCSEAEVYGKVAPRSGFRYLSSPEEDGFWRTINGSSGTVNEQQPLSNGTKASEAVLSPVKKGATATTKIQRTADKATEQPVTSGVKVSSDGEQASVKPLQIQRTADKVNAEPVKAAVEVPSDGKKATVEPKIKWNSDEVNEEPVKAAIEVPSDGKKASVKPKIQRTADKVNEEPVKPAIEVPSDDKKASVKPKIQRSSDKVNEEPVKAAVEVPSDGKKASVKPKIQRAADKVNEEPVKAAVEVPSDGNKALVKPKIQRTSDKVNEEPVKATIEVPSDEDKASVKQKIQRTPLMVIEEPVTSGVEVPSDGKKASVKPKTQRSSDNVNEEPVSKGNKASGVVSPGDKASGKLPPKKTEVIGIQQRSGIQPRSDGDAPAAEASTTAAPEGDAKKEAAPADGSTPASGAAGTETTTSAPGNETDFDHLVEPSQPHLKKKQLKKKFARFLRQMKRAEQWRKTHIIMIVTTNHEVTTADKMTGDTKPIDTIDPGFSKDNDTKKVTTADKMKPIDTIDPGFSKGNAKKKKGSRMEGKPRSRLRARSSRNRWARTSFRAPQWIAVD